MKGGEKKEEKEEEDEGKGKRNIKKRKKKRKRKATPSISSRSLRSSLKRNLTLVALRVRTLLDVGDNGGHNERFSVSHGKRGT